MHLSIDHLHHAKHVVPNHLIIVLVLLVLLCKFVELQQGLLLKQPQKEPGRV